MDKTGKRQEEAYFYQRDRELIEAMKKQSREEELAREKKSHLGHCGGCGGEKLVDVDSDHGVVKICSDCQSLFVDSADYRKLLRPDMARAVEIELNKLKGEDSNAA